MLLTPPYRPAAPCCSRCCFSSSIASPLPPFFLSFSSPHLCSQPRHHGSQPRQHPLPLSLSRVARDNPPFDSNSQQKYDYDEIEALILSPPSNSKGKSHGTQAPTLLERQALAVDGSVEFTRRERNEAVNGLLDLLEHKGVPPGYAFEFVRHAGELIDELIVEAKGTSKISVRFLETRLEHSEHAVDGGGLNANRSGALKAGRVFLERGDSSSDVALQEEAGYGSISVDSSHYGMEKESPSAETNIKTTVDDSVLPDCTEHPNVQDGQKIYPIEDKGDPNFGMNDLGREKNRRFWRLNTFGHPLERMPGLKERKSGVQIKSVKDLSLASKVSVCADRRGIPRLVYYFQVLNMKAFDIAKVLPFVGESIDVVMAKVEFLRSIGVRTSHLPTVLASWPQLLIHGCDHLAVVAEYLKGLGLTHKEIGTCVQIYPQILGRDVERELKSTVSVLEDLGVSLKDVKQLIVRHPILLTEEAEVKLRPLVGYLESIGVKRGHIGPLLIRRPALLNSNVEKDLWPIGDYLKSINASEDDIDKIITSFPWLFRYDLDQDFRPTISHLESLGVDPIRMGKIFRRHPQLLKNRLNFVMKTNFLLKLGLDQKDLGKVIFNAPQLFGLSIEDKMVPNVHFLESIGVHGACLVKVLKLKPMILAYSIDTKLQPNVKFLQTLGMKCDDVGKLVTRHPQLLTLSVEKNLKPTVTFLLALGFTREDVVDMVRRLPSLLGFSTKTVLEPKYNFLVDIMKRSKRELVQFPQFFSYSLVNRIIPRYKNLRENFHLYSLSSIYCCSDLVFAKRLHRLRHSIKDRRK